MRSDCYATGIGERVVVGNYSLIPFLVPLGAVMDVAATEIVIAFARLGLVLQRMVPLLINGVGKGARAPAPARVPLHDVPLDLYLATGPTRGGNRRSHKPEQQHWGQRRKWGHMAWIELSRKAESCDYARVVPVHQQLTGLPNSLTHIGAEGGKVPERVGLLCNVIRTSSEPEVIVAVWAPVGPELASPGLGEALASSSFSSRRAQPPAPLRAEAL
eukprot:GHVU01129700.1.p1 GENE.GHVU01129700.1~~GHVU01129700.1.p1  ORF type:complete len:216 (+),score=13.48 GHVU01129700.1:130-777(+)